MMAYGAEACGLTEEEKRSFNVFDNECLRRKCEMIGLDKRRMNKCGIVLA